MGDYYVYSGEGTKGHMKLDRGNRAIRDHEAQGTKLYLFFREKEQGAYVFLGEFRYASHFWCWGPDKNGLLRKALIFLLEPQEGAVREGVKASLDPDTALYLEQGHLQEISRVKELKVSRYIRSLSVARETLRRAGGICELCKRPAPFSDINGEPFLEVHHIIPLSEGGADDVNNTAALCPNCHRAVHYSEDAPLLREKLRLLRKISGSSTNYP
ncbi:hypothetical protein TthHC11_21200 (plasmid) [Thermus thermophilus]|nr:hypothetical protein TthHC11_21200 [Thermus thermophilus]